MDSEELSKICSENNLIMREIIGFFDDSIVLTSSENTKPKIRFPWLSEWEYYEFASECDCIPDTETGDGYKAWHADVNIDLFRQMLEKPDLRSKLSDQLKASHSDEKDE